MATWIPNCTCQVCCNWQRINLSENSGETFSVVPEGWTLTEDGVLVAPDGTRHIPRRNAGFFRPAHTVPRRRSTTLLPGEDVGEPNPPVNSIPNESFLHTYQCENPLDNPNTVTVLIPAGIVDGPDVATANQLAIAQYAATAALQLNCDVEVCSVIAGAGVYSTEPFVLQCVGGQWYSDPWTDNDGWTENE